MRLGTLAVSAVAASIAMVWPLAAARAEDARTTIEATTGITTGTTTRSATGATIEPAPREAAAQGAAKAAAPAKNPLAYGVGPCKDRPDTLGVSRVVEIDTTGGPAFGLMQYKGNDFLEPGEIVLTFDDGPLRHNTQKVLAALDGECTRATFFSVGKMAISDPQMLREVDKRGHTVGSHTWSHRNLHTAGPAKALGELELGVSAVSQALGHPAAPFFRFPYLADSQAMKAHNQSRNQAMFSIDIDSLDYRTRDPATVQRRVLAGLKSKGKGIILFHDIQPSTANALPALLAEIRKRGYKVVHLVAKAPIQTLPEYDAIAERELNRKNKAIASNPLANRSMTWANSSAPATNEALASSRRKPVVKQHKTAEATPPGQLQTQRAPSSSPPPRPRRYQEEQPWWKGIFSN